MERRVRSVAPSVFHICQVLLISWYISIIIFIGAAKCDAFLMWTNWVTVKQAVHICWFNGNDIGADKYVSQLGN